MPLLRRTTANLDFVAFWQSWHIAFSGIQKSSLHILRAFEAPYTSGYGPRT